MVPNASVPWVAAVGAIKAGTTIDRCDLSYATFGINYYVNPGVRFMLDYYRGDLDLGNAGHDRPQAVDARVQIVF
mgnify:CR=1 FL=1